MRAVPRQGFAQAGLRPPLTLAAAYLVSDECGPLGGVGDQGLRLHPWRRVRPNDGQPLAAKRELVSRFHRAAVSQQLTLATGSLLASCLADLAPEATARSSPEGGQTEICEHRYQSRSYAGKRRSFARATEQLFVA